VEDLVRVRELRELLRAVRAWVEVGVVLARQAPIRATDLARGRVAWNAQHPVEVEIRAVAHSRSRWLQSDYRLFSAHGDVTGTVSKLENGLRVNALVLAPRRVADT
jgi:hypothetical protein